MEQELASLTGGGGGGMTQPEPRMYESELEGETNRYGDEYLCVCVFKKIHIRKVMSHFS